MDKKSPHPIDVHVGTKVRIRRLMLNMSQDKLGDALGLTFQQIQKYEKGTNRIGASRLYQLAKILSVDVQFFYNDMDISGGAPGFGESQATEFMSNLTSPESIQLCRYFSTIDNPQVRKKILDLIKAVSESQNNVD